MGLKVSTRLKSIKSAMFNFNFPQVLFKISSFANCQKNSLTFPELEEYFLICGNPD